MYSQVPLVFTCSSVYLVLLVSLHLYICLCDISEMSDGNVEREVSKTAIPARRVWAVESPNNFAMPARLVWAVVSSARSIGMVRLFGQWSHPPEILGGMESEWDMSKQLYRPDVFGQSNRVRIGWRRLDVFGQWSDPPEMYGLGQWSALDIANVCADHVGLVRSSACAAGRSCGQETRTRADGSPLSEEVVFKRFGILNAADVAGRWFQHDAGRWFQQVKHISGRWFPQGSLFQVDTLISM